MSCRTVSPVTICRVCLSFMSCTGCFCRYSGSIRSIFMTGVRSALFTVRREIVSGAEAVSAAETVILGRYWNSCVSMGFLPG